MQFKERLYKISPPLYGLVERIYQTSPLATARAAAANRALHQRALARGKRDWAILTKYLGNNLHVLDGPFRGMIYGRSPEAIGSDPDAVGIYEGLGPQLIGSYEAEIANWISAACELDYDRILDVGCAEGFYAVGFAVQSPRSQIVAFDTDERALAVCAEYAKRNGVANRVVLKSLCNHADLQALLGPRTLLFCDIEGAERDLLSPTEVPRLRDADIIVETHDFRSPGITATLVERFRSSHRIEIIGVAARKAANYPVLEKFPQELRSFLLDELRSPDQCWMRMIARSDQAS